MSTRILVIFAIVLGFCISTVQADDITFTSSGTIDSPQVWDHVTVQNDGTTLQIFGGTINYWLDVYNASNVEIHGGAVGSITTYDYSTVNQTGGTIKYGVDTGELSTYNLYGGNITGGEFVIYGQSTANILGGSITTEYLKMATGSVLNIKGGYLDFGSTQNFGNIDNHGTVNIYGYGFNYNPTTFTLTGKLADNSPFSFNLGDPAFSYRPNLIVVPEPVSLCLLAFGGLLMRRRF